MKPPPRQRVKHNAPAGTGAAGVGGLRRHTNSKNTTKNNNLSTAWQAREPWAGLFRVLVATYQLDLPYLRRLVLHQIKREANRER